MSAGFFTNSNTTAKMPSLEELRLTMQAAIAQRDAGVRTFRINAERHPCECCGYVPKINDAGSEITVCRHVFSALKRCVNIANDPLRGDGDLRGLLSDTVLCGVRINVEDDAEKQKPRAER